MSSESGNGRKAMGWPAASALITCILGVTATTVAFALAPNPVLAPASENAVSGREIGRITARLDAIEKSIQDLQLEVRELRRGEGR